MELKLNIYRKTNEGGYEIEKTYIAETIDIMFGTAEDLINLLDDIDLNNTDKMVSLITRAIAQIKPFLKDIFIGLKDDELRRTKLKELIPLFMDIFSYLFKEIGMNSSKKK